MGRVGMGSGGWWSNPISIERQRSKTKLVTNFTNLKEQIYAEEQINKPKHQ